MCFRKLLYHLNPGLVILSLYSFSVLMRADSNHYHWTLTSSHFQGSYNQSRHSMDHEPVENWFNAAFNLFIHERDWSSFISWFKFHTNAGLKINTRHHHLYLLCTCSSESSHIESIACHQYIVATHWDLSFSRALLSFTLPPSSFSDAVYPLFSFCLIFSAELFPEKMVLESLSIFMQQVLKITCRRPLSTQTWPQLNSFRYVAIVGNLDTFYPGWSLDLGCHTSSQPTVSSTGLLLSRDNKVKNKSLELDSWYFQIYRFSESIHIYIYI